MNCIGELIVGLQKSKIKLDSKIMCVYLSTMNMSFKVYGFLGQKYLVSILLEIFLVLMIENYSNLN